LAFDEIMYRIQNMNEALSFVVAILSIAVHFLSPFYSHSLDEFLVYTGAATLAIVPHELAHRQTARRYGCYSRFQLFPQGLILTVLLNFFAPFLIFTSGYTAISCGGFYGMGEGSELAGKTAVAGPITNLVVAGISLGLAVFYPLPYLVQFFLVNTAYINAFVGLFNMIPFGVFDGYKIFRWNKGAWIVVVLASLGLLFFLGGI
jgi:Zn-dependent protease